MGYMIKALALLFVLSLQVAAAVLAPLEVMGLLLLVAFFIFREKYQNLPLLIAAEALLIFALALLNPSYLALAVVTAYDLAMLKFYPFLAVLVPVGVFFLSGEWLAGFFLVTALSTVCGYLNGLLHEKETSFQQIYDRERQTRYDLENAKGKLLNAAREAAHLAEIRERNRIAREIHDSIGHNLAGILLQLQVAVKTLGRDETKARELFAKSITGLAGSVDLLRETVHNIKPREQVGLDYVKKVTDNFQFCPVTFKHSGDFAALTASQIEIITSTLKEALTNAARHSEASEMDIRLDIQEKIVRLYIKDNGKGCDRIQEGLGLSGMRERVCHVGGNISIHAQDGFMIVCVLPRDDTAGGGAIESIAGR